MQLTTTLNKIRACSPCASGWKTLTTALGVIEQYGGDTPLNLLTILDTNGAADMLWCLRATDQDSRKIASQLATEFALDALPIFEGKNPDDHRPRAAIQAAKDFNDNLITLEQLHIARRDAASAASASASASASADAAYAASAAASASASASASAYAAYAAADAADAAASAASAYAADAAASAYAASASASAYAASAAAYAAYAAAQQRARDRQATIIRSILEKIA